MHKTFIFILFLMFLLSFYAQTDTLSVKSDKNIIVQKKFDAERLEKYKADKEFDYSEEKETREPTYLERALKWLGRQLLRFIEWIFGVKYAKGIFGNILSAIPYVIVGLLLFFMLRFFLRVNSNSIVSTATNKSVVSITEDEALIKRSDLSRLIEHAIGQKNYRLAIRYYYLNILKQLENKELISFEQQKTNEDYIKEISKEKIGISFKNLTRLYDFVWYGNFDINEVEFSKVEADFKQMERLINNSKLG